MMSASPREPTPVVCLSLERSPFATLRPERMAVKGSTMEPCARAHRQEADEPSSPGVTRFVSSDMKRNGSRPSMGVCGLNLAPKLRPSRSCPDCRCDRIDSLLGSGAGAPDCGGEVEVAREVAEVGVLLEDIENGPSELDEEVRHTGQSAHPAESASD